jgi:hypothetical protein
MRVINNELQPRRHRFVEKKTGVFAAIKTVLIKIEERADGNR